jgi:tetratricopeptide (TPR) repeat protein
VRRSGDQLRVTVQLIRASDSFHLWSETYDRAAEDIFAVQEEIAEKIAAALDVVLDKEKRDRMFQSGTRNVEAFEAFQRGRAVYEKTHDAGAFENLFDANSWLERAIALDPDYSAAYLMHADAYFHFLWAGAVQSIAPTPQAPDLTGEQALQRLRADLENAYETNRNPDSKVGMDYTRTVFSDSWHRLPALIRALEDLHRAGVVLNDEGAWYGFQTTLGDTESYLAQVNSRQLLNPLFAGIWGESIIPLLTLDRYAEAIEKVRRARGIAGDSTFLTFQEAIAHALSGDLDTAIRIFSTGIFQDEIDATATRAVARALKGDEGEARRLAAEVEAQFPQYDLLWVYHQLGDEEKVTRLAREIDAGLLGPQRLVLSIGQMGNRMVFSIDDTPNLRARLSEMGIDASRFRPMPRFTPVDEESDE